MLVLRVKTNAGVRAFTLWNNVLLSVHSAISVGPFKKISLTWLFPIDIRTPDGPLMLWNRFIDFAVEDRFGCRATEHGFARDIGAIET